MVDANAEVVRRALELNRSDIVNEGHIARALDPWDPNCEFTSVMSAVEPETYRGHHGLRRYVEELSDSWDEWRMEVEDVSDVGSNTVIATFRSYLVGKGSGAPVEARRAMLAELSRGKVLRARVYASREEALEALKSPQ